jgi:membrane-associated phospholipid phosphatase
MSRRTEPRASGAGGTVDKLGAIWITCALFLGLVSRRGIRWTSALVLLTAIYVGVHYPTDVLAAR